MIKKVALWVLFFPVLILALIISGFNLERVKALFEDLAG